METVGHILREIFRHIFYFIKTEGDFVNGTVISTKFRPSPTPAGGLEIPFLLKFSCNKQAALYDYNFVGTITEENSDEEDEMTIGTVGDSHPHRDQQLVCYSDNIGTVTVEGNSDEED